MAYSVELTRSAEKELSRLSASAKGRMLEALEFLALNPFSEILNIKKLKGAEWVYRLRVGDYRLVYEVQKQPRRVLVVKIGHRKEVYRD